MRGASDAEDVGCWPERPSLVAVTATGGVVVMSSAKQATSAAQEPPANTATVEKGKLSDMVSQYGTLTYRARSDGSPYPVINQARGTYTKLPDDGDKVDCGDVLYRVNDKPGAAAVRLDAGLPVAVGGRRGRDVAELNANLHAASATRPGRSSTRPVDITSAPRRRRRSRSCSRKLGEARPGRWTSVMRSSCPSRCGSPR